MIQSVVYWSGRTGRSQLDVMLRLTPGVGAAGLGSRRCCHLSGGRIRWKKRWGLSRLPAGTAKDLAQARQHVKAFLLRHSPLDEGTQAVAPPPTLR